MVIAALFYKDFFQPPPSAAAKMKSKVRPSRTSQVRFHDQVRVKKIKPIGKNKSLYEDDSSDEIEDDGLLEEDNDGNINGMDWNDESDEDEEGEDEEVEEMEGDDDENEESAKVGGRQTIERLKHELFAEEEEEDQNGKCPQSIFVSEH